MNWIKIEALMHLKLITLCLSVSFVHSSQQSHGNNNGNERTSRDRSMSPVINSLLYTDCKRQRMSE